MCDYAFGLADLERPAVGSTVEYVEKTAAEVGTNDYHQSPSFFGTKGVVITEREFAEDMAARYGGDANEDGWVPDNRTPIRWTDKDTGATYIGSAYTAFLNVIAGPATLGETPTEERVSDRGLVYA